MKTLESSKRQGGRMSIDAVQAAVIAVPCMHGMHVVPTQHSAVQ
jgi:hypothetical protein